jgi:hypothetical protein
MPRFGNEGGEGCEEVHTGHGPARRRRPGRDDPLSAGVSKGRDYEFHGAVDGLRINDTVFDFEETGVVERDA